MKMSFKEFFKDYIYLSQQCTYKEDIATEINDGELIIVDSHSSFLEITGITIMIDIEDINYYTIYIHGNEELEKYDIDFSDLTSVVIVLKEFYEKSENLGEFIHRLGEYFLDEHTSIWGDR